MNGNPFATAVEPAATVVAPVTPVVETPVIETPASVTPAPVVKAPETPVVVPEGEGTLLGEEEKTPEQIAEAEKAATDKAAADAKAKEEAIKNETPEQKAAREKAEAEAAEKAKTVPDKYVVKAPEGMKVDEAFLNEKLTPILKEHKVTQAALQAILDVYAPHLQAQQKAGIESQQTEAIKAWKDNVKAWGEETKAAYGPNLNKEMAYAAKAINQFSSDPKALRELMNDKPGTTGTGIGNNKLVVEFMIKAGKLLGEDTFPKGSPQPGNKDNSDEAKAERMFGKKP